MLSDGLGDLRSMLPIPIHCSSHSQRSISSRSRSLTTSIGGLWIGSHHAMHDDSADEARALAGWMPKKKNTAIKQQDQLV